MIYFVVEQGLDITDIKINKVEADPHLDFATCFWDKDERRYDKYGPATFAYHTIEGAEHKRQLLSCGMVI